MKEALQHTSHTRSILVRTRTNFGITIKDSFAPYTQNNTFIYLHTPYETRKLHN